MSIQRTLEIIKRTTITATRVGVKGSAHTFCVLSKRTSPHAYVWAKQLAPTRLFFFLSVPLTRLCVGKMHNAHTTSLSHLPHGPTRPRVTVSTRSRSCNGPDPL